MYRQHHLKQATGGRIVKPPHALERFVRVDVDLRNGAQSAGAQSHLGEAKVVPANQASAAAVHSGKIQNRQPLQVPDIDEVADVRRLD